MTISQEDNTPTRQDVLVLYERVNKLIESGHSKSVYEGLRHFMLEAREYKFAHLKRKKDVDHVDDEADDRAEDVHLEAALEAYPQALVAVERGEAVAHAARAAQKATAQSAVQVPESRAATDNPAATVEGPTDESDAGSRDEPPSGRRPRVPIEALPPGVNVCMVAIRDIVISPNREPDPDVVRQLKTSISDLGLLNPIILTPEGELVAGRNRVAAYVELGYPSIEARIETWSTIDRELVEIDENLVRRRLPVLERGRLLARRKELYEVLHPEARQHTRGGHAKAAAEGASEIISPAPAFASDAAAMLDTTARTIQEEIRIAKDLAPDAAELILGTPLADEKVRLMQLTHLPRDQQAAVTRLLIEGRTKSVRAAVAQLKAATDPSSPEADRSVESDRSVEANHGEEADGSEESAQQPMGAGGTDTATAAIERHGPLPKNALAPLTQEQELPVRGAEQRSTTTPTGSAWTASGSARRLPTPHTDEPARAYGADLNDEELVSIPGALAEVRDKLKRWKPGSMNADLVTTLRELVTQCDRELKLHEEAIVSGVEDGGAQPAAA